MEKYGKPMKWNTSFRNTTFWSKFWNFDSMILSLFVGWFGLMFYLQVNTYGHVETVSAPIHTFFLGEFY